MSSASSKKLLVAALSVACLLVLAPGAWAQSSSTTSGGATFVPPPPPPAKGALVNGRLVAPASAPRRVKQVIAAANRIVEKPYVYGGGHTTYRSGRLDRGYDCSGAVSYALHGGRFLRSPLPSGMLMNWGQRGPGQLDHRLRARRPRLRRGGRLPLRHLDARPRRPGPVDRPRWSSTLRTSSAFVARHPRGY